MGCSLTTTHTTACTSELTHTCMHTLRQNTSVLEVIVVHFKYLFCADWFCVNTSCSGNLKWGNVPTTQPVRKPVVCFHDWWLMFTVSAPTLGMVFLGAIRKQNDQAVRNKPVSTLPWWPLFSSLPDFLWWWTVVGSCKPKWSLSFPGCSCPQCLIQGVKTLTKTLTCLCVRVHMCVSVRGQCAESVLFFLSVFWGLN